MKADWAKIHCRWYEDPVISVIADQEADVLRLWPILIGMAKEQSDHVENPLGTIKITSKKLGQIARMRLPKIERILALLVDGECIELQTSTLGFHQVTLTKFHFWNNPRGSASDRKQKSRDFAGKKASNVTLVSQDVTRGEERREEKNPQTPLGENHWSAKATNKLAFIHRGEDGRRAALRSQILDHQHKNRHLVTHTPEAYVRAAEDLAKRYANGWRPNQPSRVIGYYLSTVASHSIDLADTHTEPQPTKVPNFARYQ